MYTFFSFLAPLWVYFVAVGTPQDSERVLPPRVEGMIAFETYYITSTQLRHDTLPKDTLFLDGRTFFDGRRAVTFIRYRADEGVFDYASLGRYTVMDLEQRTVFTKLDDRPGYELGPTQVDSFRFTGAKQKIASFECSEADIKVDGRWQRVWLNLDLPSGLGFESVYEGLPGAVLQRVNYRCLRIERFNVPDAIFEQPALFLEKAFDY